MSDPVPVLTLPNADASGDYAAIAIIAGAAVGMVLATMMLVKLITRVANRIELSAARATTYECGEEPIGSAWIRFNNRFYLIAILFLGCDTLLALLLPVLPRFTAYAGLGQAAAPLALVLGGIALIGLMVLNAARQGDLHWNKGTDRDG